MEPIGTVNGLVIDCADPIALAGFWGAVFAVEVDSVEEDPPRYVDLGPRAGVPVLRFQRVPEVKSLKNRLHLDDAVERVRAYGGRPVGPRDTDFGYHFRVMADPEGNEFCLIEEAGGHGAAP